MKRAALIVTDADAAYLSQEWHDGPVRGLDAKGDYVGLSEQLLADLRTLAEFPGLIGTEAAAEPPGMAYVLAQVDPTDWQDALDAAARVRALLPEGDVT